MRAKLGSKVRAFIVQALACFGTPSQVVQVVQAVKVEFGIEISRQLCESHDPTKRAGRDLAKCWVTLFHDTRKQFQAEAADIAIANRAYRLRALGRMAEEAEQSRNYARAAALLEQAAKEAGDLYANRRPRLEGRGAVQIPSSVDVEFTHRQDGCGKQKAPHMAALKAGNSQCMEAL